MKPYTKNILITAGSVAAAAALGVGMRAAINSSFVNMALDRKQSYLMRILAKRITAPDGFAEYIERSKAAKKRLDAIDTQTVTIRSFDGLELIGHLYPADKPKRVILAMHGWRSKWSRDFGVIADFWHDNDCMVLYAEQRGQGTSGGDYMGFGMLERRDCLDWVKWLNENGAGELPIYLAGVSMGASTVLMASGLDDMPKNVHGIIADCGFTSADNVMRFVSQEDFSIPYKLARGEVNRMFARRLGMRADACSTLDAMEKNTTPVLFIHGSADTLVPVEMTEENYAACRAPKRKLIVEGADHALSYLVDTPAYQSAVLDFWKEFDK